MSPWPAAPMPDSYARAPACVIAGSLWHVGCPASPGTTSGHAPVSWYEGMGAVDAAASSPPALDDEGAGVVRVGCRSCRMEPTLVQQVRQKGGLPLQVGNGRTLS